MSYLLASTALVLCLSLGGCGGKDVTNVCTKAGGTVVPRQCCKSASEFPNTCVGGACGCSAGNSASLDVCECPPNECFNGMQCLAQ